MRRRPIHLEPAEIPETAIVMGDPDRARALSKLLDNARLVSSKRGFLVYTGTAPSGKPVAIASHGIGGPSALIVLEELAMMGARTFIRIGTAGGLDPALQPGDVLIASSATMIPATCGLSLYYKTVPPPLAPDPSLLARTTEALRKEGIEPITGPVFCSDSFYAETPTILSQAKSSGAVAVDMETAALYGLSNIRKLKSLSILIISNIIQETQEKWLNKETIINKSKQIINIILRIL